MLPVDGYSKTQKEFDEIWQPLALNERRTLSLLTLGDAGNCELKYDICVFLLMWGLEIYLVE